MLNFADLDQFKTGGFPVDYPANVKRFFSPQDQVHLAIKSLLSSATQSLYISMFGEDDPELTAIIIDRAADPNCFVQLNLDRTQAAGKGESALVAKLQDCPATRVAVGTSASGLINHLKIAVVDSAFCLGGSTNWSTDGEGAGDGKHGQNNEATVHFDRVMAAEAIRILSLEHQEMVGQEAKRLEVKPPTVVPVGVSATAGRAQCSQVLAQTGMASPRTCQVCGLGPCAFGYRDGQIIAHSTL